MSSTLATCRPALTDRGVLAAWALLDAFGVPAPFDGASRDARGTALAAWRSVLGDLSDDELAHAVRAWLRWPDQRKAGFGRQWPTPGAILEALGEVRAQEVEPEPKLGPDLVPVGYVVRHRLPSDRPRPPALTDRRRTP